MMKSSHKVVLMAALLTFGIGFANSMVVHQKMPEVRFFIGNGILFLALTAMAEWEPEVANALAIAVATFALLGDHGGVISHYLSPGGAPLDTHKKPGAGKDPKGVDIERRPAAPPGTAARIGLAPVRPPIIPNMALYPLAGNEA